MNGEIIEFYKDDYLYMLFESGSDGYSLALPKIKKVLKLNILEVVPKIKSIYMHCTIQFKEKIKQFNSSKSKNNQIFFGGYYIATNIN